MEDGSFEKVKKKLPKRIKDAIANGLSTEERETFKRIINRNKSVFRIGLRSGGPENGPPMQIAVDSTKRPAEVKVWKDPAKLKFFRCVLWWVGEDGIFQKLTANVWTGSTPLGTERFKIKVQKNCTSPSSKCSIQNRAIANASNWGRTYPLQVKQALCRSWLLLELSVVPA